MPKYPAQIDNDITLPKATDNKTPIRAKEYNSLRDAIVSIQNTIGTNPSGVYSNLKSRLQTLENTVGNLQIIKLENDLGGTLSNPTVVGIQNNPIAENIPSIGDALVWNGIAWAPSASSGVGILNGDITGLSSDNIVSYIKGVVSPDPTNVDEGDILDVKITSNLDPAVEIPLFDAPTFLLSDSNYVYIAQKNKPPKDAPFPDAKIYKLEMDGKYLKSSTYIDLSSPSAYTMAINDFAQDDTYLYVTFYQFADIGPGPAINSIAIIQKSTMTVVGWGSVASINEFALPKYVTTDNNGHFYCYAESSKDNLYFVCKFTTASCLGNLPGANSDGYISTDAPINDMCFGNNKLWLVGDTTVIPGTSFLLMSINTSDMTEALKTSDIDTGAIVLKTCVYWNNELWSGYDNNIYSINPVTGLATNTYTFTGFNGIENLLIGPDSAGNLNSSLYCTNFDNGKLGVLTPGVVPETVINNINSYICAGTCLIGNYIYIGVIRISGDSTIGYVYQYNCLSQISSAIEGYQPPGPPDIVSLQYVKPSGDLLGPITSNIVQSLRNVQTPILDNNADGTVLTLNQLYEFIEDPSAIYNDSQSNYVWVVDRGSAFVHVVDNDKLQILKTIKLNNNITTPSTFTWQVNSSTAESSTLIESINRIVADDNYIYVGTTVIDGYSDYYNNIAVINKSTFNVVANINLSSSDALKTSAYDFCSDNNGNLWVSTSTIDAPPVGFKNVKKYNVTAATAIFPKDYSTVSASIQVTGVYAIKYFNNYLWASGTNLSLSKIDNDANLIDLLDYTDPVVDFSFQKRFEIINNNIWFTSYDKKFGYFDLSLYPNISCINSATIAPEIDIKSNSICYDSINDKIIIGNTMDRYCYIYDSTLNFYASLEQTNVSIKTTPSIISDIGSTPEIICYVVDGASKILATLPSFSAVNIVNYDTDLTQYVISKTYFGPNVITYDKNSSRILNVKNLSGTISITDKYSYYCITSPGTYYLPPNAEIGTILEFKDTGVGSPFTITFPEGYAHTIDGSSSFISSLSNTWIRLIKTSTNNWSISGIYEFSAP